MHFNKLNKSTFKIFLPYFLTSLFHQVQWHLNKNKSKTNLTNSLGCIKLNFILYPGIIPIVSHSTNLQDVKN